MLAMLMCSICSLPSARLPQSRAQGRSTSALAAATLLWHERQPCSPQPPRGKWRRIASCSLITRSRPSPGEEIDRSGEADDDDEILMYFPDGNKTSTVVERDADDFLSV